MTHPINSEANEAVRAGIRAAIELAVELFQVPAPDEDRMQDAIDEVLQGEAEAHEVVSDLGPLDTNQLSEYVTYRHEHGYALPTIDAIANRLAWHIQDPRCAWKTHPKPKRIRRAQAEVIPFVLPTPKTA